jgi:hypothetical protein
MMMLLIFSCHLWYNPSALTGTCDWRKQGYFISVIGLNALVYSGGRPFGAFHRTILKKVSKFKKISM